MTLKFGQITTIVISSPAIAKEVLQRQDLAFSSRNIPDAARAHDHDKYSVVWLPVESRWRSLRKLLNSSIFSHNKLDATQQIRVAKVQELIAYCLKSSQSSEAIEIGRAAFTASLNLLSNTIFSKDLTDPFSESTKEFKDLVWDVMEELGKPNMVDFYPLLQKLDPQGIRRRMTVYIGKVLKLFSGLIDERLEQKKMQGTVYNDVLDVLLAASEQNPEQIDKTQIENLCVVLFLAATDTTSSTVEWAMTELLKSPECMKRTQEELALIIGRGKPLTEADIARLPYLYCVVKETFRLHPPAPFLVPRKVQQNVEVCGYTVPKGSQVLVNAWAIGRDPTVWKDSEKFKPDRFWGSEIDIYGRDYELIPFGAGRRICPGLTLAMRMVPLMLGSLLNSFDWKLDEGMKPEEVNLEEKFGITLQKADPLRAIPIPI